MHGAWLAVLLVWSIAMPVCAEVTLEEGARLIATLRNETGATSTAAIRIRRCGRFNDGRAYCHGRFRRCVGPACRRRAGFVGVLPPEPVGVGPGGLAIQVTRLQTRCQLLFAQGSRTRGTYSCQFYGDGTLEDSIPYDHGAFALTEAPAKH